MPPIVPNATAAELRDYARKAGLRVFRDDRDRGWATLDRAGHHEHHLVRSRAVKAWLQIKASEKGWSLRDLVDNTTELLEADAQKEPVTTLHVRVACHEGAVYLDLGDDDWTSIKVTADGWDIERKPPVKFRRPRGLLPLPEPKAGGRLTDLARFLRVESGSDEFVLMVAALVGWLRGRGPYPVVVLQGPHGCGKSWTARQLATLIDPQRAPLRAEPHDVRDLCIAAYNTHVLGLDNVSAVRPWLSDALCRLATGGGFSTRQLYSDDDELILDIQRPALLTSIVDPVERPDLIDRAIVIRLDDLPDLQRRTEEDLGADFKAAHACLLGALLEALTVALRREPAVVVPGGLPRLADFVRTVVAAEPALPWPSGRFLRAYRDNRAHAVEALLDEDGTADALVRLLAAHKGSWSGTAGSLLRALHAFGALKHAHDPRQATGALRRLAPALRQVHSITVEHGRAGKQRDRLVHLKGPESMARKARRPENAVSVHPEDMVPDPASDPGDTAEVTS